MEFTSEVNWARSFLCGNVYNSKFCILKSVLSDVRVASLAIFFPLTAFKIFFFITVFHQFNIIFFSVVSFRFVLLGFLDFLVSVGL